MSLKRIILEMGHGNDMHGGDYTKAALRAVDMNHARANLESDLLRVCGLTRHIA